MPTTNHSRRATKPRMVEVDAPGRAMLAIAHPLFVLLAIASFAAICVVAFLMLRHVVDVADGVRRWRWDEFAVLAQWFFGGVSGAAIASLGAGFTQRLRFASPNLAPLEAE